MARARTKHLATTVTPVAQFHAYVLGSVIGIRWGKIAPNTGMGNEDLYGIVKEYLTYAYGEDEWKKLGILDAMRYKSASAIKDDARYAFPSLFPRHRKARPLGIPDEISDEEVSFDPSKIEEWKERAREIKKEIAMSENATEQEATVEGTSTTTASSAPNSRVTVNFYIPEGVNPEDLTLENYREVTGKRYRMTKDQVERKLSRESAFAESKALAISQLGGR